MKRVLATGLLFLGFNVAFGAEGRIEISQPTDRDCTNGGGSYFLSRDVDGTGAVYPGGVAIRIIFTPACGPTVGNVQIDLNGYTVTGGSTIVVEVTDFKTLVIRNGSIVSTGTTQPAIKAVSALTDSKVILEDVKIAGGLHGIEIDAANVALRRNFISASHEDGIRIDGVSPAVARGAIEDNVFRNTGASGTGAGLRITGSLNEGLIVRNNLVENSNQGMVVADSTGLLLNDNYFFGGTGSSGNIVLSDSSTCIVVGNRTAASVGHSGILLANVDSCLLTDNVSNGHGVHGIALTAGSTGNTVDRNVANKNTGFGIYFDGTSVDNKYGRNSAYGNTGSPTACTGTTCGAPPTQDLCDEGTGNMSFLDNLVPGPPC